MSVQDPVPGGMIQLRIPVNVGNGDSATLLVKIREADARKIVDAPRRVVRELDLHLVQLIRDGLRRFFEEESEKPDG